MSNFIGGLLSAASSFLPGGGLLSKIIPGAVSAIGDIASKVINRPEGQGIGDAILEAAPDALMSAAGLAKTAGKHLKAAQSNENVGEGLDVESNRYNAERGSYPRSETVKMAKKGKFGDVNPADYIRKLDAMGVWGPGSNYPESQNATDRLPVVHGPPSQPALLVPSGPLAAHNMPPANEYNVDRTQQQSNGSAPSFNVFDRLSRPKEIQVREEVEEIPMAKAKTVMAPGVKEAVPVRVLKKVSTKSSKKAKKHKKK